MTREEFIKVLEDKGYPYEIEGNKIVVTHGSPPTSRSSGSPTVYLNDLTSIPPNVEFRNRGDVILHSLNILPLGTEFRNDKSVFLGSFETLSPGAEFRNGDGIYLKYVKSISPGVEFNNGGGVYLESLLASIPPSSTFGGRGGFHNWPGNIEGIEPNRLLNKMIADGLFNRR